MNDKNYNLDIPALKEVAITAAKRCAYVILNSKNEVKYQYKNTTNPISSIDLEAENSVRSIIKKMRPKDSILGEEMGITQSSNTVRWVVDPIDGTTNYLHNIPHWCISIACEQYTKTGWQVIVGVVYDVLRDEMYLATLNDNTTLNNKLIKVSQTRHLKSSLIATELSYDVDKRLSQVDTIKKIAQGIQDIRSTGSSALNICWVAAGRFDAFFESDLYYWDWAAGSLILSNAGGKINKYKDGVIATNTALHPQLMITLT